MIVGGSTRRRLVFVAPALMALMVLVPGAGAKSLPRPQVDASQQVTQDPNPARPYATPSVAVDPMTHDVLAVNDGEGRSANCRVQISMTAGLSWTQTADVTPPGYPACVYGNLGSFADVTFGPDGVLYVALSGQRAGDWQQKIFLASSTDAAAFVAWDDTRNSAGDSQAQDVYLGPVQFPTTGAVFATTGRSNNNRLLWSLLGAAVALSVAGLALLGGQRFRGSA